MRPGESVVVHAAAGGVGTLALQLAKRWGAGRVIAVASSEQKRGLALELGADVAIDAGGELRRAIEDAAGGRAIVGGTYPLAEARRAHEDLRARRTTGKLVLDPRA